MKVDNLVANLQRFFVESGEDGADQNGHKRRFNSLKVMHDKAFSESDG